MDFESWYDCKTFIERNFLRECWLNSNLPDFEKYLHEVYEQEVVNAGI